MSENQNRINWYPGHMAKAIRQLNEQIRRIDLIIEICDARLPYSSRNPELDRLSAGKRHMLLLNKSDMADPDLNKSWLRYFRSAGMDAFLTDATKLQGKVIVNQINQVTEDIIEKARSKGIRKTIRGMIVGIPNVGKSTLINRLCGRKITQTGDRPGVTKSNQWVRVSPYLELLDTPGLLWPRLDDQEAAKRLCYLGSVKDDVLDLYGLTIHLLEELCGIITERVAERFHIEDTKLKGLELLDAVCSGRGWLLKGNQYDYDRACNVILDEFRGGKLGRITLERPEDFSDRG